MSSTILNPICRGIVGYISYLASCNCSQVYSEYLLYEPILRIAQSKGYSVQCEFPLKDEKKDGRKKGGDYKRIDFKLCRDKELVGIEVKWARSKSVDLTNDISKLCSYIEGIEPKKSRLGYIVIFGKSSIFKEEKKKKLEIIKDSKVKFAEGKLVKGKSVKLKFVKGKRIEWNAGKTSYSARWFKVV